MHQIHRDLIYDINQLINKINIFKPQLYNEMQSVVCNNHSNVVNEIAGMFFIIYEIFMTNTNFFANTIKEYDYFGFSNVKRNTRCAIEAYVDLYNLIYAESDLYMELLKHIETQAWKLDKDNILPEDKEIIHKKIESYKYNHEKFKDCLRKYSVNYSKGFINFSSKLTIAKRCMIDGEDGKNGNSKYINEKFSEYSSFAHPNIFARTPDSERDADAKELIKLNIYLISFSISSMVDYLKKRGINTSQLSVELNYIGIDVEQITSKIKNSNQIFVFYNNNYNA
jgi:hypothetical protein